MSKTNSSNNNYLLHSFVDFASDEVCAVLSDLKTEHRFALPDKLLTDFSVLDNNYIPLIGSNLKKSMRRSIEQAIFWNHNLNYEGVSPALLLLKGGDYLWVREDWCIQGFWTGLKAFRILYKATPTYTPPFIQLKDYDDDVNEEIYDTYQKRVKLELVDKGIDFDEKYWQWKEGDPDLKFRPSSLMPLWASRILLEVESIYIEESLSSHKWDLVVEFEASLKNTKSQAVKE